MPTTNLVPCTDLKAAFPAFATSSYKKELLLHVLQVYSSSLEFPEEFNGLDSIRRRSTSTWEQY